MNNSQERWEPVSVRLPDGREWPSISACARAMGLHVSTVRKSMDRGTLAGLGSGSGSARKGLRCGVLEFSSISEAADWMQCSVSPLSTRRQIAVSKGLDSFEWRGRTFHIPAATTRNSRPACQPRA